MSLLVKHNAVATATSDLHETEWNDAHGLTGTLDVANGGTGASSAAGARTNLGLVPGTDVQAYSANLASLAGFTTDTDGTLTANSDTKLATQKAVKTYTDAKIAAGFDANDAMQFKGALDCSASPNYPAASAGWTYRVSVAGKIGGASGTNVEIGDTLYCIADGTAAGTQAAVGANWVVVQSNIDGAVIGPASAAAGNFPVLSGTTGKVLADSGVSPSSFQGVNSKLTAISGLTLAADKLIYWTGAVVAAVADLTAFGRSLIGAADAAAVRVLLAVAGTAVANTFSAAQSITDATASTSTTTGALKVSGGVGIAGDLNWAGSAWAAFTPTAAPAAGAFTSVSVISASYKTHGKTVFFTMLLSIANGTGSGGVDVLLPVAAAYPGSVVLVKNTSSGKSGSAGVYQVDGTHARCTYYDGTHPISATENIFVAGSYQSA